VFYAVALGEPSGCILLSHRGSQIFEWALMLLSQGDRVCFHALGVLQQKRFEAAAIGLMGFEELRHRPTGHDRQVAAK